MQSIIDDPAVYGVRELFKKVKVPVIENGKPVTMKGKQVMRTERRMYAELEGHYPAVILDPHGSIRERIEAARAGRHRRNGALRSRQGPA